jgi:hypothetical protein
MFYLIIYPSFEGDTSISRTFNSFDEAVAGLPAFIRDFPDALDRGVDLIPRPY